MTEVSIASLNVPETSTRKENHGKRRAPARSSSRIAKQESAEANLESKALIGAVKQEKKSQPSEKKPFPRTSKPDLNRETVITEHGHKLHPNGMSSLCNIMFTLISRSYLFDFRTPGRTILYRSNNGIHIRRSIQIVPSRIRRSTHFQHNGS